MSNAQYGRMRDFPEENYRATASDTDGSYNTAGISRLGLLSDAMHGKPTVNALDARDPRPVQQTPAPEPRERSLDVVSRDGQATAVLEPEPKNLWQEAMDLMVETSKNPQGRARQAELAAHGLIVGGIKEIPNQVINHPAETVGKIVMVGAAGAAFTALAAAEAPLIAGGSLLTGVGLTAATIMDSVGKATANTELQAAMQDVWDNDDPQIFRQSTSIADRRLGPVGFDYGLGMLAGGLGFRAARQYMGRGVKLTGDLMTAAECDPRVQIPKNVAWHEGVDGARYHFDSLGETKWTRYPDGTLEQLSLKSEHGRGFKRTFKTDGSVITEHANGARLVWTPGKGGSPPKIEITYADGVKRSVLAGQEEVCEYPEGRKTRRLSNGSTIEEHPNGTSVHTRLDGSKQVKKTDGTYDSYHPDGTKENPIDEE